MKERVFQAGAAVIDTTPTEFPRKCNGGFVPGYMSKVNDPLHVRAIVLDDGKTKIAFATIDACGMNDQLRNQCADEASRQTGIPSDQIMISSTHCHSAPALTLILGCDADEEYVEFVKPKIIEAIVQADRNRQPARIGWGSGEDRKNVFCRRFYMREGTALNPPAEFTGAARNVAQMNPGYDNENAISPTGVPDPEVSVLSLQSLDGKPLALLANYSTHYADKVPRGFLSADYFGVFCRKIAEYIDAPENFVAIMTNGTSGDCNCVDFLNGDRKYTFETVGDSVAKAAQSACKKIEYQDWVPLSVKSSILTLEIRKPTESDRDKALQYIEKKKLTAPKSMVDLYAFDTVTLYDAPSTREIRLQAFRLGGLEIAAIPCEVYSLTGRSIKHYSPAERTFTISMANGYFGYIPTTESFELGGYNTWRACSCCLEKTAEPKIRAEVLRMLKELAGKAK